MTSRGEQRVRSLCPACGADLIVPAREEPQTYVCQACGAHVLRREDHRHFVFDHRDITDERVAELARQQGEIVHIPVGGVMLTGALVVPANARGLVLFAHGSGSSRLSPRNLAVASGLGRVGLATLLFDLLPGEGSVDRSLVFDIPLLADRLSGATAWAEDHASTRGLPLGYFGASTGSAAALSAAADRTTAIRAVVSRGGRPDLVDERLGRVTAPTLLIVGGHDPEVLALNVGAAERLRCHHRVEVIPGATHLFEEPGTLERVGHLAAAWFLRYLPHRAEVEQGDPVFL